MPASFPASMLNQSCPDLGIPNRINLTPSRSRIQRCLEQGKRAEYVGLQKSFWIDDRSIHMRLGSQMCDAYETMLLEQPPHQRRIPDIAFDEQDAAIGDQRFEASGVRRLPHGIDDDQPVVRVRRAPCMHKVLADETRAAGDQNALHRSSLVV
jgi:hypothetical protein